MLLFINLAVVMKLDNVEPSKTCRAQPKSDSLEVPRNVWDDEPLLSQREIAYKVRRIYTMLQFVSGLRSSDQQQTTGEDGVVKLWPFPIKYPAGLQDLESRLVDENEKHALVY